MSAWFGAPPPRAGSDSSRVADPGKREHGVDRVKAVAIASVVVIHTLAPLGLRTDLIGRNLFLLAGWAVPAFFFTGGYLRARTTPYPPGEIRRWLVRLLPAYLIASFLAFFFRWFAMNETMVIADLAVELLNGSAWGIYYFVPLFLGALLFSSVLARFPRLVPLLAAISVVALVWTRIHVWDDPLGRRYGFFGIVRSPFFWWGYFVIGWVVKQRVADRYSRRTLFLVSTGVAAASILALLTNLSELGVAFCRVTSALGITMSLLFASERPAGVIGSTLSRFSYEIYLFHFFAIAVARLWGFTGNGLVAVPVVWLGALLTGLALGIPISRAFQFSGPGSRVAVPSGP